MNDINKEACIDALIDLLAELGILEIQIREMRENIEPLADRLFALERGN
ncbi:hypothetical protein [uncultured Cohaesibacter sp.]|jgi:hypothetical protein|nr:hypothetical protein [uncultured Cohaesibacter sp.]